MIVPVIQTISSKGQLVIPAKVRKELGLTSGSKVSITTDANMKSMYITPISDDPVTEALGFLKRMNVRGSLKDSLKEKYAEIARGE